MEDFQNLTEMKLASERIFEGQVVHLYRDTVKLPDGSSSTRETIRHIGAVAVVPVTEDGKVIVERQFRYPLNRVITEIAAGKLDSKEEDPLEAAKRELEEETGIRAREWTPLGVYHPAAAYCGEKITMYLAKGLEQGQRKLDEDEFLNIRQIPLEELVQEIMEGKVTDGKTLAAVMKAYYLLKNR